MDKELGMVILMVISLNSSVSDGERHIPDWNETFMQIAYVIAQRSKDPRTQVGCVIVSHDNRVLSMGYNGTPRGVSDDTMPWGGKNKYPFVVHAERNAVINYKGSLQDMYNGKAFVTHRPCQECLKELIQVGIHEIYYKETTTHDTLEEQEQFDALTKMAGITVTKM